MILLYIILIHNKKNEKIYLFSFNIRIFLRLNIYVLGTFNMLFYYCIMVLMSPYLKYNFVYTTKLLYMNIFIKWTYQNNDIY